MCPITSHSSMQVLDKILKGEPLDAKAPAKATPSPAPAPSSVAAAARAFETGIVPPRPVTVQRPLAICGV